MRELSTGRQNGPHDGQGLNALRIVCSKINLVFGQFTPRILILTVSRLLFPTCRRKKCLWAFIFSLLKGSLMQLDLLSFYERT